ncbi:MAG: hypothetical protein V2I27_03420 [Erythrobacter sp.]|jgi:hypothetical protein|nr:hypothetical protein [Erythrobacter sp.]
MKWQRGPRPFAIRLFALAFLAAALIRLVSGLTDLTSARQSLARIAAPLGTSDDAAIVTLSAEFTIALIPLVWIYGLANRHARWLVLGFGGLRLAVFAAGLARAGQAALSDWIEPALIVVALAALLTRQARGWLKRGRSADAPLA